MKTQTDAMQSVDEPGYRLWCAEPAFVDESRASWIQRLCGSHFCSFQVLGKFSGIKLIASDWDRPVTGGAWSRLLAASGQSMETCSQAIRGFAALKRLYRTRSMLQYEGASPSSRWCRQCLASDRLPYLRWEWRLSQVTSCSLHRMPLSEFCPWCKSPLYIRRSLLAFTGHGAPVSDLATCASCGMSLFDAIGEPQSEESVGSVSESHFHDLIRIIKDSGDSPQTQLELNLARCHIAFIESKRLQEQEFFPGFDDDGWAALYVKRKPNRATFPLLINGETFREKMSSKNSGGEPRRWTSLLRPQERVRMARVLSIVRKEIRANTASSQSGAKNEC